MWILIIWYICPAHECEQIKDREYLSELWSNSKHDKNDFDESHRILRKVKRIFKKCNKIYMLIILLLKNVLNEKIF